MVHKCPAEFKRIKRFITIVFPPYNYNPMLM